MAETPRMQHEAHRREGERLAPVQAGNFVELLRRDKMEAAELKAHDAKLRNCEGSGEKEAVQHKAAGAAVNMVQKEALTQAMTRLASQGIARFGQQETQKNTKLCGARPLTKTHTNVLESSGHQASDGTGLLHVRGQGQKHDTKKRSGRVCDGV